MRQSYFILMLVFIQTLCFAENKKYKTIEVGLTTTIHVIFPSNIISYDIGLGKTGEYEDILSEQPSKNRLKLAAGIAHFQNTNLFVETEKAYYNFILTYNAFPENQLITIEKQDAVQFKKIATTPANPSEKNEEKDMIELSEDKYVAYVCKDLYEKSEHSFLSANAALGIIFQLDNIYVKQDKLYLKFSIKNQSNVKYEIGYLGYLIKLKGKGKKQGVVVDETVKPYYTYQTFNEIQSSKEDKVIAVFDKFTMDKKKNLIVNLWEKEGERMIELKINPQQIVKAQIIKN